MYGEAFTAHHPPSLNHCQLRHNYIRETVVTLVYDHHGGCGQVKLCLSQRN